MDVDGTLTDGGVCLISTTAADGSGDPVDSEMRYPTRKILVGCALRREDLATLDVDIIQLREGRWVLADLEGKGRRVRTVAFPGWVKQGINAWMAETGVEDGRLLRAVSKGGKVKESIGR
jgi:integrase